MKNKFRNLNDQAKFHLEQLMEEIHHVAFNEGYEAGKLVGAVDSVEDNTITHEGKLLRKVNREAREGDYVRPSKQKYANLIDGEIYGPVFKGSGHLFVNGYQVYAEGHNRTTLTVEVFEDISDYAPDLPQFEKTANQQRAELIEKAKRFVKESIQNYYNFGLTEFEFVVNAEKRTVVALEQGNRTKKVYKKGIAKCDPSDVFNEWIGKAISLARALKIDIPVEFLQAVQPSEKVVGMIVKSYSSTRGYDVYRLVRSVSVSVYEKDAAHINSPTAEKSIIIDDTNAQYEVRS